MKAVAWYTVAAVALLVEGVPAPTDCGSCVSNNSPRNTFKLEVNLATSQYTTTCVDTCNPSSADPQHTISCATSQTQCNGFTGVTQLQSTATALPDNAAWPGCAGTHRQTMDCASCAMTQGLTNAYCKWNYDVGCVEPDARGSNWFGGGAYLSCSSVSNCDQCTGQKGGIYKLNMPFGETWYAAQCVRTCRTTINLDDSGTPFSVSDCVTDSSKCAALTDRFGSPSGNIGNPIPYNATNSTNAPAQNCYTPGASFDCPTCQTQSNCHMATSLASKQQIACVERAVSLDASVYGAATSDCRPDVQGICDVCLTGTSGKSVREELNLFKGTAKIDCVRTTGCLSQYDTDLSQYTRCITTSSSCKSVTPQTGGGKIDTSDAASGACFRYEGLQGCEECVGASKECNYYLTRTGEGACVPKDQGYPILSPALTNATNCPTECSKCPQGFKYHMTMGLGLDVAYGRCEMSCQSVAGTAVMDYCVDTVDCSDFQKDLGVPIATAKTPLTADSCWYHERQNSCNACTSGQTDSSAVCAWYGNFCGPKTDAVSAIQKPVECTAESPDTGTQCAKCPSAFQVLLRGDKTTATASCVRDCLSVDGVDVGLELAYQVCVPKASCSQLPNKLKDVFPSNVNPTTSMGELPLSDGQCWGKDCYSCSLQADDCTYLSASKVSGVNMLRGCVPNSFWRDQQTKLSSFYTALLPGQSCESIEGVDHPFGGNKKYVALALSTLFTATALLL